METVEYLLSEPTPAVNSLSDAALQTVCDIATAHYRQTLYSLRKEI